MSTQARKTRDELMALAVAQGSDTLAAGKAAGLSRATAYRRSRDPAFRAMVAGYRSAMLDQAVGSLAGRLLKATDKLVALIDSKDEQVSLRASIKVVDKLIDLREHADLAARLEALEALIREQRRESAGEAGPA